MICTVVLLLSNSLVFEARLCSVKKAGSLTKFSSMFTLDLDVVLLCLQLHCEWDPSAAKGKNSPAILGLTTAVA